MAILIEGRNRIPEGNPQQVHLENPQQEYVDKLLESLGLEIKLGYTSTGQGANRLEKELDWLGVGPEGKQYFQSKLEKVIDDIIDNKTDAYIEGDWENDTQDPEDNPDYLALEHLRYEVGGLKKQLTSNP